MTRRVLELPTASDTALRGLVRLERLVYLLSHDRDGNPLPPVEAQEQSAPVVLRPGRDGVPTWKQMEAVLDRAAERDRRREEARVAREHPPIPLHRQLALPMEGRSPVGETRAQALLARLRGHCHDCASQPWDGRCRPAQGRYCSVGRLAYDESYDARKAEVMAARMERLGAAVGG